jgi:hypothetical protein
MRIVDRKTMIKNMGETYTAQNFGTLLGSRPERLGTVVTMYPNLAISKLTENLLNVYTQSRKAGSFTNTRSMVIEWDIEVNFIKKVNFSDDLNSWTGGSTGINTIYLEEKYYDKGDTFTLENKQLLFVVAPPRMIHPRKWEHKVQFVTSNAGATPNVAFIKKGRTTRFRSNYFPELSERGYTKFISNTESHRNFMSCHRNSADSSGNYNMLEDVYIEMARKSKNDNGKQEYVYFKMERKEKQCLDSFIEARNNNLIFGQSNHDANGKCLMQDEKGRDIPMGDGIIAQIERYCDKFAYQTLTIDLFEDAIAAMTEKCDAPTGNTFAAVCNEKFYNQLGRLMRDDLRFQVPSDGSYFYSKEGGKVKVGADFNAYHFQGNTISFLPDRALSQEYPNHGYAFFLDAGLDATTNRPNIAMFTLEGAEMLSGTLKGMGGLDGRSSGDIATPIHGSSYHLLGYSCAVVFNPYKAVIMEEAKVY